MKKFVLSFLLLQLTVLAAQAQKASVFNQNNVAVHGYDVVAFFTNDSAIKGDSAYRVEWEGVQWWFANAANAGKFKTAPQQYAPQYGGYCAFGTAGGYKAPTAIDTWTIVNGKLYFNYNKKVKETWTKNRDLLIIKADTNWPQIKNKE